MKIFLILLLFSLSFSKTIIYDVYLYFFKVGNVKIELKDNETYAEGKTSEGMSWLYTYDFKFVQKGNEMFLYEREKNKERIFRREDVYRKKLWLPLIVEFIKEGRIKETNLFKVKDKGKFLEVFPTNSKRIQKIVIKRDLKSKNIPQEIIIYGKVKLSLKLKDVRED
ncbi:MAG: hypothetical protein DSY42_02805 [Aquifex sp.]|nr:MAG: hypothetical protein DSY42_02805 [Aquifex sp.]